MYVNTDLWTVMRPRVGIIISLLGRWWEVTLLCWLYKVLLRITVLYGTVELEFARTLGQM
jgi:hypothetical protein